MSELKTNFLKSLVAAPGPSSFESQPATVWRKQAESYNARIYSDAYGNCFASFGPEKKKPHVMLSGHIDEIGLMLTYIDKDGFLYFTGIGGWDSVQLIGQRVRVLGFQQELVGVIGKKAIHLMKPDERKKAATMEDMWIDIGAKDEADARAFVREGDVAVIEQPYLQLLNNRIASKALDNRIGAYIVLEAANRCSSKVTITAAATVQEEIGHMGAKIASYGLEPDLAIAVDVTHATDIPSLSKTQWGDIPLASGASLTIGSITHRGLFNALIECAEKASIPYTIEAAPKRTATDGDDIAKSRSGIPTAVVSVPTRYMHSPNEMIDLKDVEACISLLVNFIDSLDETSHFSQP